MGNQLQQHTFYQGKGRLRTPNFVARHVHQGPALPEKIIITIGPGRSHTTAWLLWWVSQMNKINPGQYLGANQRLKWLLRDGLLAPDLHIPSGIEAYAMKETWSADRILECTYDPVQILVDAGIPSAIIHLQILIRPYLPTYGSWWYFTQQTCPANFALALNTALQMVDKWQGEIGSLVVLATELMYGNELKVLNQAHQIAGLPTALGLDFDPTNIWRYLDLGETRKVTAFAATVAPVLTKPCLSINGVNGDKASLIPERQRQVLARSCEEPYQELLQLSQQILEL